MPLGLTTSHGNPLLNCMGHFGSLTLIRPGVRDTLIENPDLYPFETFSEMYSQCVSVNWPYGPMDAIVRPESGSPGEVTLKPYL